MKENKNISRIKKKIVYIYIDFSITHAQSRELVWRMHDSEGLDFNPLFPAWGQESLETTRPLAFLREYDLKRNIVKK